MRLIRPFALLLALLAPLAQAQTAPATESTGPVPYHLEVVLFRQGEPSDAVYVVLDAALRGQGYHDDAAG